MKEDKKHQLNLNRHTCTRKVYKHKCGTIYTSLPKAFADILNEETVTAVAGADGKSVVLIPASKAKVTVEAV